MAPSCSILRCTLLVSNIQTALHQCPFFPTLDHNNFSRLLHCSFWFQMHSPVKVAALLSWAVETHHLSTDITRIRPWIQPWDVFKHLAKALKLWTWLSHKGFQSKWALGRCVATEPFKPQDPVAKRPTTNVPMLATSRPKMTGGATAVEFIELPWCSRLFPKGRKVVGAFILGGLKAQSYTSESSR